MGISTIQIILEIFLTDREKRHFSQLKLTKKNISCIMKKGLILLFLLVPCFGGKRSKGKVEESDEDYADQVSEETVKGEKVWITGNITFPFAIETEEKRTEDSIVKIGSFNMKQFGKKKASNEEVLRVLAQIVISYDLIALQEITDASQKVVKKLIDAVNKEAEYPYHYVVSPRVGRTRQKEQYAFMFRPDIFQVKRDIIYDDSDGDPFSREPHIAEVIMKENGEKFGIVNIHAAPAAGNTSMEIDSLVDVHKWVKDKWRLKNIIILGDLNADCGYIRKKDIPNIRLLQTPSKYHWLITDNFDTTVGNTNCTYDRIIASGPYFERNLVKDSPGVLHFDKLFRLNNITALQVSDHYPVEISLYVEDVTIRRMPTRTSSNNSGKKPGVDGESTNFYGMIMHFLSLIVLFQT